MNAINKRNARTVRAPRAVPVLATEFLMPIVDTEAVITYDDLIDMQDEALRRIAFE